MYSPFLQASFERTMKNDSEREISEKQQAYWRKNIVLISSLLSIWAVVTFLGAIFLAEPLSRISFFQIPLSFWIAQQGAMIVFVCLVFYYAWRMDQLDREHDVKEVIVGEEREEEIQQVKEETGDLFQEGDEEDGGEPDEETEGGN